MLIIGMPAGSLADPRRGGNLIELLHNAGFYTSGYDNGGPSRFTTVSAYIGWDGRPQEFGSQLGLDELDVAIGGDDWIRERVLEFRYEYDTDIRLEKALSLNRGKVKIVGIVDEEANVENLSDYVTGVLEKRGVVTVVSEMPYLALDWVKGIVAKAFPGGEYQAFSVQKYKTPSKIREGIVIYETWGKTEAKIKNGGADLGLEITQTGSALRNYGLKVIENVMQSETGIWVRPALYNNNVKRGLLEMFLLNLSGALNAENKVLLLFNVPNDRVEDIESYIRENKLFADEPTRNEGLSFCEYSLQVNIMDSSNPVPRIRYELALRGAQNIDTVPLLSSIQALDKYAKP